MPAHEQFNVSRTQLLNAYDEARVQGKAHAMPVHHGNIGESEFRNWLRSFLPKRYGVTAGYIVSQRDTGLSALQKFDVIVYDILNSPVLWLEGVSGEEKVSAIPVEYVRAIFEVKAALTPESAKAALTQLEGLRPYLSEVDSPGERYPAFLPDNFFCMTVFFELRKDDVTAATSNALRKYPCRGYAGAVVLRGEGRPADNVGCFQALTFEKSSPPTADENLLHTSSMTLPFLLPETLQEVVGWMLWTSVGFSHFAFDIVALLNGTYQPGRVSSFHGLPFGVRGPPPAPPVT